MGITMSRFASRFAIFFMFLLPALGPISAQAKCLFIGDSIALGSGKTYNNKYRQNCEIRAKIGASSTYIVKNFKPEASNYDFVVVSMGSNNPTDSRLSSDVKKILQNISANTIIWLLPYNNTASSVVASVAEGKPLPLKRYKSDKLGVHPAYSPLVRDIELMLKGKILGGLK